MSKSTKLTAGILREELWTTLQELRSGKIEPVEAAATASLAHGILKTVRVQLEINQAMMPSKELIKFAADTQQRLS